MQELDEIKMFSGNHGRLVLGQLINDIPKQNYHSTVPQKQNQVANVRDPSKFKYNILYRTKNYF